VFAAVNKHAFIVFGIIFCPFRICPLLLPCPLEKKGTEGKIIYLDFHPEIPSPKTLTALPSALSYWLIAWAATGKRLSLLRGLGDENINLNSQPSLLRPALTRQGGGKNLGLRIKPTWLKK
jgi:hypothetical protein